MMTFAATIGIWPSRLAVSLLIAPLAWESLQPCFRLFAGTSPGWLACSRHGLVNLAIGLLNTLMTSTLFVGFRLGPTGWPIVQHFGLLHWMDVPRWLRWPRLFGAIRSSANPAGIVFGEDETRLPR